MIFTHSLYLAHDKNCPDLLVALAKEPQLYEEAREIYLRNANITIDNEEAFHHISLVNLRRIKHLKVVLPLRFQAQVITLENNLMSLTIDTTGGGEASSDASGDTSGTDEDLRKEAVSILQLILAASKMLQRLAIKLEGKTAEKEIAEVAKGLGFEPAREVLYEGAVLCTWETRNGAPFWAAGQVWHRLIAKAEQAEKAAILL